jgi:hypothetical protein
MNSFPYVVMLALIAAALITGIVRELAHDPPDQRIEHFCMATYDAVRADRRAFESEDVAQRELAYERFYEGHVMYHNSDSFEICVDKVPALPIGCRLNRDWKCLANLARTLELALKDRPR